MGRAVGARIGQRPLTPILTSSNVWDGFEGSDALSKEEADVEISSSRLGRVNGKAFKHHERHCLRPPDLTAVLDIEYRALSDLKSAEALLSRNDVPGNPPGHVFNISAGTPIARFDLPPGAPFLEELPNNNKL